MLFSQSASLRSHSASQASRRSSNAKRRTDSDRLISRKRSLSNMAPFCAALGDSSLPQQLQQEGLDQGLSDSHLSIAQALIRIKVAQRQSAGKRLNMQQRLPITERVRMRRLLSLLAPSARLDPSRTTT